MKKTFLIRAFLGLAIMALGGILLLRNLGIITFDNWHLFWGTFWAGAFLLAGLSVLVGARKPAAWIWGLLLVAIGASIGLNTYNVISISMWELFWPAMLIAGGLMLALSIGPGGSWRLKKPVTGGSNTEQVAIFYSEESRVTGDYSGGSVTAIFGSVDLDLRQAKITDGAVIDIFTLCGGASVRLPDGVTAENQVRGILGGSENKTAPSSSATKTIYLRGVCVLGGLEIK